MSSKGWQVTKHYLGLDTAWRAEFVVGTGGRTLGVNSEMDALPGIGHACGHNLIAIAGVGVALAIKAALEKHSVPGKVVLLGTPGASHFFGRFCCPRFTLAYPAEEGGAGKIILIERGGYRDMDACVMYATSFFWSYPSSHTLRVSSWTGSPWFVRNRTIARPSIDTDRVLRTHVRVFPTSTNCIRGGFIKSLARTLLLLHGKP